MERLFALGNHKMKPSLKEYTNLMLAWQRSGRNESADAIQQIFDNLKLRSTNMGGKQLRPDRYIFGILIECWARRKNFEKSELLFEEMIREWKDGNDNARPDSKIFHAILHLHAKNNPNRDDAVKKTEYYFSLMKEIGLPLTIQACAYLIEVLSTNKSANKKDIKRANEVLDELLNGVHKGFVYFPPKYKECRHFLQTIANSCISHRNHEAKKALSSFSRSGGLVSKELLTR